MEYDIEQDAFHLPVKLGEKTIPKWSAVLGATALDKEIRQRAAVVVADETTKQIDPGNLRFRDCAAAAVCKALEGPDTSGHHALREAIKDIIRSTVRNDLVRQLVADELSTPARQRAAEELTARLYRDVAKIVHAEVGEKLGDELQKRLPLIAQAVLETPARDLHVARAALGESTGDLARFAKAATEYIGRESAALSGKAAALQQAEAEAPDVKARAVSNIPGGDGYSTFLAKVRGETRRMLEEEFAAPGPALSRDNIIERAIALGLQVMANRRHSPKVARADIPAEYEYDPSTDTYTRHGVSVSVVDGDDFFTYVPAGGVRVLRNRTMARLDLAVKAKASR